MALHRETGSGQPDEVRLPYPRHPAPARRAIEWKPVSDAYYLLAARLRGSGYEHELYIAQRVLLQIMEHAAGADQQIEGTLWGRLLVSPETGVSYVVIADATAGAGVDGRRTREHPEGQLRPAGWYCSRWTIGPQLSPDDVLLHLERCTGGWEPVIVLAPGHGPPDGAVFLVSPMTQRSYRAPFRELPELQLARDNAPKRSCVPWRDYVTTEPVVALPARERALTRRTSNPGVDTRSVVSQIAEGVVADVLAAKRAVGRAIHVPKRRSGPTAIFSESDGAMIEERSEPLSDLPTDRIDTPTSERHDGEREIALEPTVEATAPATVRLPEPTPSGEHLISEPSPTRRTSGERRPVPRHTGVTPRHEDAPRIPALVLILGAIAALIGAIVLGTIAVRRALSERAPVAATVVLPAAETSEAALRRRTLVERADSLRVALGWYEDVAADHTAGRLSCALVSGARERVSAHRVALVAVLARFPTESIVAAGSRALADSATRVERAFAESDCAADGVTVRSEPTD